MSTGDRAAVGGDTHRPLYVQCPPYCPRTARADGLRKRAGEITARSCAVTRPAGDRPQWPYGALCSGHVGSGGLPRCVFTFRLLVRRRPVRLRAVGSVGVQPSVESRRGVTISCSCSHSDGCSERQVRVTSPHIRLIHTYHYLNQWQKWTNYVWFACLFGVIRRARFC